MSLTTSELRKLRKQKQKDARNLREKEFRNLKEHCKILERELAQLKRQQMMFESSEVMPDNPMLGSEPAILLVRKTEHSDSRVIQNNSGYRFYYEGNAIMQKEDNK